MSTTFVMPQDWTRQVQSSEETGGVGVVTQDDTFKNIGIARRFTKTTNMEHEEIPMLGLEDLHADESLFQNNGFALSWLLFDTRFLRFCTEIRGGAGTIGNTNTFLQSVNIAGTQLTRIYKGTICDRITIEIAKLITVSGNFRCTEATNWLNDAAVLTELGTTWAPAPTITSAPWTHRTSATNTPFSYGGSNRDLQSMTLDISRNPAIKDPLGWDFPKTTRAGARRIGVTLNVWVEDNTPLADVVGLTPVTVIYTLQGATPVTVTLNNFKPNDYSQDNDSASNDALVEQITGTAQTVQVSSLTVAS